MAFPKVKLSDDSGNTVDVTSNALDVNIAGGASIDIGDVEVKGHAEIGHGKHTTVGTSAEYLIGASTSVPCKHIDIMAATGNTGIIAVGGSGVTIYTGIVLYPGDVYSVDIENLNLVYVVASVLNEDVQWVVYN